MRKVASKELRDIWVTLLIGTNRSRMVKSVLVGKVLFDVMMMLDEVRLQLTVAVIDEQEMLVLPDVN